MIVFNVKKVFSCLQTYHLEVLANDGIFQTKTQVDIEIIDVNGNKN